MAAALVVDIVWLAVLAGRGEGRGEGGGGGTGAGAEEEADQLHRQSAPVLQGAHQ